jgi:hypothetical protein
MLEPEFRERIQNRLVSPARNIHIRVNAPSLTETVIADLKNIESLTWLELNLANTQVSDI